ncbi:MAG: adenylate kinase [Gemmatimonadota bacterium]|nr:adenylate kinase [Gemmatimonadota bacterium]
MNVILLGPPGSGKGTQGELLAHRLGMMRIVTGDLLRDAVQRDADLGRQAKEYMDRGSMVPDAVILQLVKQQLASPESAQGVLLDGFPRTIRQAEEVNRMLVERGEGVRAVLLLNVPEDELIRRLLARASAEGRSDETAAVIKQRLERYRRSTALLVGHYRERGVLTIVTGTGTVDDVAAAIKKVIGE